MIIASRSANRRSGGQEMLPVINVVFLLMIFFSLLGTVGAGRAPPHPLASAATGEASQGAKFGLDVDAAGALALEGQPVADAALPAALTAWRAAHPNTVLSLAADARVSAQRIVAVLAFARGAGIARVDLLVRPERTP